MNEERINAMVSMIESGDIEGFLNDIDQIAASAAYLIIRDHINDHHVKLIKNSTKENYQKFQDIKLRAKQSWDYDHKTATIEEVNRACANVYTILLRLIKVQNSDFMEEFTKIQLTINKIEGKVGLETTTWDKESDNINDGGTDDANNVQGVEENI